jgi:hypothetical protein
VNLIQKNRSKKDCGVVAMYNAAIISGLRKRYSTIEKIAISCGYDPKVGIYRAQLRRIMNKLELNWRWIEPVSTSDMEERLSTGKIFVIAYNPDGLKSGHVIVLLMAPDHTIRIINPGKKYAKTWTKFKRNIAEYGMKDFYVYEITNRRMARRNAKSRST